MGSKPLVFAAVAMGLLAAGRPSAPRRSTRSARRCMKGFGQHMGVIKGVIVDRARAAARRRRDRGRARSRRRPSKIAGMFPDGQQPAGETEALPVIWEQWPDFEAACREDHGELAEKLAEAAGSGDAGRRRSPASRTWARTAAAAATRPSARRSPDRPACGWAALALALAALLADAGAGSGRGGRRPAARRAAVPHRRLHQLPHRQGRRRCWPAAMRSSSPFGDFYAPNITPDPDDRDRRLDARAEFIRAMREGRDPEGRPLYPAFPYTSYTRMTDEDLTALKAYLDTLPAVSQASKPHELWFPFNLRWGLYLWQWAVLHARALPARPGQGRRLEPRRLSRARARPLRRVPHAAHLLRRARAGPRLRRGAARQGEGAQHHRRTRRTGSASGARRRPRHRAQARHDARTATSSARRWPRWSTTAPASCPTPISPRSSPTCESLPPDLSAGSNEA